MEPVVEAAGDRPATEPIDEIEITPEMIEAGLSRAYELLDDWPAPAPVAKNFILEVLKAGIEARKLVHMKCTHEAFPLR